MDVKAVQKGRESLLAYGFKPVPVYTDGKRPIGFAWQKAARDGKAAIVDHRALNTGIMCDGLRVIDIDIDDDDMASQIAAIVRERLGEAPERYRDNSPRRLLVYRAESGEPGKKSVSGQFGKVEVLGYGQQFVAFGTHPSGANIKWIGKSPAEMARDELPIASEAQIDELMSIVGPFIGAEAEAPKPSTPIHIPDHRDGERSLAEIRDLLFCIPPDCPYDEWKDALMAVHAETGGSGQGLDLVDDWSSRGSKYRGRKEIETKWRSFKRSGVTGSTLAELARRYGGDLSEIAIRHMERIEVPQSVIDSANAMLARHLEKRAQEIAAEKMTVPKKAQFSVGGDWTQPGGILQDISDWIETTSRRPNRPLAVAAAIGVVGTVCGRHIAGPTISGTHLYMVCIGDTAIGKDRPLKAAKQVLVGAGLPQLSVTGKFMSAPAVENTVAEHPCCLAVVDEIGSALFARMAHKRASTHESAIASALRELWSSSFDIFQTSARAQEQGREIMSPAFSIFGASTVSEFYNSLGSGVVENGLLNRFLIIRAAKRAKPVEVDPATLMDVPKKISDGLLNLLPTDGGDMETGAAVFIPTSQRKPLVVPWASDEVRNAFAEFDNDLLERMDADPEIAPYLGRTAEMTIRLATIYAVSRFGRFAEITMDALQWGMALATESAQTMMDDIREQIVENDQQARYKMVEKIVKDAGTIRLRELNIKINGRMSRLDLTNILRSLCDAGKIVEKPGKNNHGTVYDWA